MKTSFVIDRSKWRCGGDGENRRGQGVTLLLNDEGEQCCLGQICSQCGIKDGVLFGVARPSHMARPEPVVGILVLGDFFDLTETDFSKSATMINDNELLTDTQRERQLERLAEEFGLRIEFVGEFVNAANPV